MYTFPVLFKLGKIGVYKSVLSGKYS